MKDTYLVTGAAGFIGFFLSKRLLEEGNIVVGIDNLNEYYDVKLKFARLEMLKPFNDFTFHKMDISEKDDLKVLFEKYKFDYVINLAAQAGVRHSIENPDAYIRSNIIGFFNILEMCRYHPVKHLIYASSSSVYGNNPKVPFEETDNVDNPVSLYAATKKSNELMAATYSHLFKIPATGLRFFTVYGPWGRPDMAYFSFLDNFFNNRPVQVFNNGDENNDLYRDFTYIDDIVTGIFLLTKHIPTNQPTHQIFNIGNSSPVKLMDFVACLEKSVSESMNRKIVFQKNFSSLKLGDVVHTYASIDKLQKTINFKPNTPLSYGLSKFCDWFVDYYKLKKD